MRKSSRGNPYHDELGRFASADKCKTKSERTASEYEERTNQRIQEKDISDLGAAYKKAVETGDHTEYEALSNEFTKKHGIEVYQTANAVIKGESLPVYQDDEQTARKHKTLKKIYKDSDAESRRKEIFTVNGEVYTNCEQKVSGSGQIYYEAENSDGYTRIINSEQYEKRGEPHYVVNKDGSYGLTGSNEIQEGMLVEYAPEWCSPGEEKYVHVVKEFRMNPVTGDPKGRALISTINSPLVLGHTEVVDMEMITPAAKSKVDGLSKKEMPWETDPKYKNNKNGKILWLIDHPESKYSNPDFVMGIKKIENMADMGVSAERRRAQFSKLCRSFDMTEEEGRHFIDEGFLK